MSIKVSLALLKLSFYLIESRLLVFVLVWRHFVCLFSISSLALFGVIGSLLLGLKCLLQDFLVPMHAPLEVMSSH